MTSRLLVIAEGDSEREFVSGVLAPHLDTFGLTVDAEKIRKPGEKGGFTSYARLRDHVRARLLGDRGLTVTTMIDLYGPLRRGGFPGFEDAPATNNPILRVCHLEEAFRQDIVSRVGDERRFIPYLQLHEFEALVLAEPEKLDWIYMEDAHARAIAELRRLVDGYESPELIDEGAETAPSKRIERVIPEYDKRAAASEVVGRIGIAKLKVRCPHFGQWVNRLERLLESP